MAKRMKTISLILALIIVLGVVPFNNAEAVTTDFNPEEMDNFVLLEETLEPIIGEDGEIYDVVVKEFAEVIQPSFASKAINKTLQVVSLGMINLKSSPKLGDARYHTIKISNAALSVPGNALVAGAAVTAAMKEKIAKAVAKAMSAKGFLVAVAVASVLALIGNINETVGNNGFRATVKSVYDRVYRHKDGYYDYGWYLKTITVGTY